MNEQISMNTVVLEYYLYYSIFVVVCVMLLLLIYSIISISVGNNNDIWMRINAEYIIADNNKASYNDDLLLTLSDFIYIENSNTCDVIINYIRDNTINLINNIINQHDNFTATCGLYYLLENRMILESNHYHWWISKHINNIINNINTYFTTIGSIITSNPDCITIDIRKIIGKYIYEYNKVMNDVIQLLWSSYIFGIYGDIVEGDVDIVDYDNNNNTVSSSLLSSDDPSLIPTWTKDTTFAIMLSGRIAKYIQDYVINIDPLLIKIIIEYNNKKQQEEQEEERPHPSQRVKQYYYHTKSGAFDNLEALKRTTFNTWGLDNGLLKGIMKYIIIPYYNNNRNNNIISIGDIGAGGGHYSKWFNNTGIVNSYAFDGIDNINEITNGDVLYMDITKSLLLNNNVYDWIISIEVAEHIPKEYTNIMVDNWNKMSRYGMIISWSDQLVGIGHVNPLPLYIVKEYIYNITGMIFHNELTNNIKNICDIDYIKNNIGVYVRPNNNNMYNNI